MANYLCRVANPRIPDYTVVKVVVPASTTIYAGSIIALTALDTGISNNYQVYTGTRPATANLGVRMALVINDGFETLSGGRRPEGQPDYTQYAYVAGDVVTAILLIPGLTFEISDDCITGDAAVGKYLEPVDGSYLTSIVASRTTGTTSALKVLFAGKNFRMGGQMGGQFITTNVCSVE